MSDLKNISVEEMEAQTENAVGIVELSDSDLESIVGGLACACRSRSCCQAAGDIGSLSIDL